MRILSQNLGLIVQHGLLSSVRFLLIFVLERCIQQSDKLTLYACMYMVKVNEMQSDVKGDWLLEEHYLVNVDQIAGNDKCEPHLSSTVATMFCFVKLEVCCWSIFCATRYLDVLHYLARCVISGILKKILQLPAV